MSVRCWLWCLRQLDSGGKDLESLEEVKEEIAAGSGGEDLTLPHNRLVPQGCTRRGSRLIRAVPWVCEDGGGEDSPAVEVAAAAAAAAAAATGTNGATNDGPLKLEQRANP